MTFGWTLAGTLSQLMLAGFLFMLVVFSAGGMANGLALGRVHLAILNLSMFLLPALCVASIVVVLYLHAHGGGASSYWWYVMPLVGALLYVGYAVALVNRLRPA
jgi:hypothetical protein